MKQEYRQAFTEVYEIFKLMPQILLDKIPIRFHEIIEENRDKNYVISIKEPLEEQKLREETIVILGLIYRDFLCSIEERKKLQEKDAIEIQEIENELKKKYNPDNIFNSRKQIREQTLQAEYYPIVVKEEKWYTKILKIIKKIFKKW